MGTTVLRLILIWTLAAQAAWAAPDTLVICPAEFRAALAPWERYRRDQGHELTVTEPPATAAELYAEIRRTAAAGQLEYIVLIGDVPGGITGRDAMAGDNSAVSTPTEYAPAKINVVWGSEPTIATDQMYADTDGDTIPDVAVGRIPADSPSELANVITKILRYEQEANQSSWRRRIDLVAGVGGFGVVADALVEAAGRRVIESSVPAKFEMQTTSASHRNPLCPPPGEFTKHVCRQFSAGSFAWIYMGHGLPTQLDLIDTPSGPRPILSVADVSQLRCGAESPLAVFIACYTGAFDARVDCLAERLLASEDGPVAVIAATRVTMPYGNTVFGCELLRACFGDRPPTLGQLWTLAQRRTLADASSDPLRDSLDAVASAFTPPRKSNSSTSENNLAAERREHVLMYHLLGDPLLRLQFPEDVQLTASQIATDDNGRSLAIEGRSELAGRCTVELMSTCTDALSASTLTATTLAVPAGPFRLNLPLPTNATGPCTVRAFISSEHQCAAGAASITIMPRGAAEVSQTTSRVRK